MKKAVILLLISVLLILTGCAKPPEEDPHPEWDEAWIRFGDVLAAETVEGFELNESSDVMSIAGLWYATWTVGEGEDIVNSQGRDAVVYDAQIYLLLKEGNTERGAEADIEDFVANVNDAADLPEKSEREVHLMGRCRVSDRHIITIEADRQASYNAYFEMQNAITRGYNNLRDKLARSRFGRGYAHCSQEQRDALAMVYPKRISEGS